MRIFVAGATGFVGLGAVERLLQEGHEILALSRDAGRARNLLSSDVHIVEGDLAQQGDWMKSVDGCDAVVNLAGEQAVGRRWTEDVKRAIRSSRIDGTENLVSAIRQAAPKPGVLINASATGYYGNSTKDELTESDPPGDDFLARLCVDWEAEARKAENCGARVIRLRLGIVLHRSGGALKKMLPPFRFGLGGPIGSGRQPFPWIHRDDVAGLISMLLADSTSSCAINAVAPDLITNREFARALGRVLRRPAMIPVPAFVLRTLFGEGAGPLLAGQRAIPKRARGMGYRFRCPAIMSALEAEFQKSV
jgi:uncharacterized protein (TIGR01777 family)